jgi:hypothetical protein
VAKAELSINKNVFYDKGGRRKAPLCSAFNMGASDIVS